MAKSDLSKHQSALEQDREYIELLFYIRADKKKDDYIEEAKASFKQQKQRIFETGRYKKP